MFKSFFLVATLATMCVASVSAQETKLTVPVKATQADNGQEMYASYCASCHGLDGRGGGPTSPALKVKPADLSQLSKNNKGAYPENRVVAVLKFGMENPAHGSKVMPVWGPALQRMDHRGGSQDMQALRISNLVKYVETLQAK